MLLKAHVNFAGEEAVEVFNTFVFASEAGKKKLTVVIEKFRVYCNPRKNVVFERYIFWKCVQKDEAIHQFVTLLKQKTQSCEYIAMIQNDMVREKLVLGIKDVSMKERLLREEPQKH